MATTDSPSPGQIIAGREAVRDRLSVGIIAAQDWCADAVHTSRRSWQQWEAGDRKMHPAFWELFNIKLTMRVAHSK